MHHFIINPASRSGKGLALWQEKVEPALNHFHIEYKAHISSKRGDVSAIVSKITSESDEEQTLVILGGDGSLNEAMQGIADFSKVILGYIPTGSSNDFARDLKIPSDSLKALDIILNSSAPAAMDVGQVEFPDGSKHRFAVSCGFGYDAAVCAGAEGSSIKSVLNKLGLGKLTYLGIALKQLIGAAPAEVDISMNDQPPIHISRFLFNVCMNHRYEGGGFMFCPKAVYNDGILDLCAVGGLSKPAMLRALPTAFKGNHYRFKGIDAYRAEKVHLTCTTPLWVHTDGEVLGEWNEITVTNFKQALRIYKP